MTIFTIMMFVVIFNDTCALGVSAIGLSHHVGIHKESLIDDRALMWMDVNLRKPTWYDG